MQRFGMETVDFDDEDNGEDKQAFENALARAAALDCGGRPRCRLNSK